MEMSIQSPVLSNKSQAQQTERQAKFQFFSHTGSKMFEGEVDVKNMLVSFQIVPLKRQGKGKSCNHHSDQTD